MGLQNYVNNFLFKKHFYCSNQTEIVIFGILIKLNCSQCIRKSKHFRFIDLDKSDTNTLKKKVLVYL